MPERETSKAAIGRTPLGPKDLERTELGARRLSTAISHVLGEFPEGARTTGGLARYLELDRSTSQRVIAASKVHGDHLAVYSRMPGIEGLRRFYEAAATKKVQQQQLDSLDAAIEHCSKLVLELAGSLAALTKRIRAASEQPAEAASTESERLELRMKLFEAGRQLSGNYTDTLVSIMVMRTSPENPAVFQCARVTGYIGLSGNVTGMPLVRTTKTRSETSVKAKHGLAPLSLTSDEPVGGFQSGAILERFSSDPFPKVSTRQVGQTVVQMIDFDAQQGDVFDVVLGSRLNFSEKEQPDTSPSFFRFAQGAQMPSRHLVMDCWQERSLARASIPSANVYRTSPSSPPEIQDRWFDRYNDCPRLVHLGQGLAGSWSSVYQRQKALTEYLFQCLGWPAEDFVGVRMQLDYPIWQADYQIILDYAKDDPE